MRYFILLYILLLLISCQKRTVPPFLEKKTLDNPVESQIISLSGQDIFGDNYHINVKPGTNIQNIRNISVPQIFVYATDFFAFNPLFVRENKIKFIETKNVIASTDTLLLKESKLIKDLDATFSFLGKTTNGKVWWKNKKDYDASVLRFKAYYKYQLSYVDSIFAISNFREDFQDFIRTELKLNYYSSMLEPFLYAELDSTADKYIQTIYSLKDSIVDLIDTGKGTHKLAKYIVYNYNRFLCRKFLGTPVEFIAQWDTAQAVFKKESKDYIAFKLIRDYFQEIKYDLYEYKSQIKQPEFRYFIDSLEKRNTHVFSKREGKQMLFDTLSHSITLAQILKKNKGNVIYIDFWASWCLPCRREMTLYKELKADFDKKNVNIMFLSIDEDILAWEHGIYKTQTQDYKHYLLPPNSVFQQLTNLAEIPRYIIIDKKGKLVEANAPRPSEKESLLKQLEIISHQ